MAAYSVILKSSAEKDLRALPKSVVIRVVQQLESLSKNPLPRQSVKLEGAEGLRRIRVGTYRIVYELNASARHVIIHYVRHRRDVYRRL